MQDPKVRQLLVDNLYKGKQLILKQFTCTDWNEMVQLLEKKFPGRLAAILSWHIMALEKRLADWKARHPAEWKRRRVPKELQVYFPDIYCIICCEYFNTVAMLESLKAWWKKRHTQLAKYTDMVKVSFDTSGSELGITQMHF